jgi:NADH-quinone oxidoreductase subunit F
MTDAINKAEVDAIIDRIGQAPEHLIPILQALQAHFNFLPSDALQRIADKTRIRPSDITGVATFYGQFRLQPAGRHTVKVCIGTACHVKGADTIYESFKRYLKIGPETDTDNDRLFTVEKVACLGCCMLAPAVQIDDITYAHVQPPKVGDILTDFLRAQDAPTSESSESPVATPAGEVRLCLCSSCSAGGSGAVHDALRDQVQKLALPVKLRTVGCSGASYQTPLVQVLMQDGRSFHYGRVEPKHVRNLLLRHFRPQHTPQRISIALQSLFDRIISDEGASDPVTRYAVDVRDGADAHYLNMQTRLATQDAGECDPLDLDAYTRHDGFTALRQVLSDAAPEAIIDTITRSELRGRGGAGFPTGMKWQTVRAQQDERKIVVCNGDEGDPGAFMDRMIFESFPFRVLEGIAIAAYSIGAHEAYIYIRHEYPLAISRLRKALTLCKDQGWLGHHIAETDYSLDITLVEGAGAFVCGEETALLRAIEGHRGMPRYRPPYPAESGLWQHPTLVNNVETFALIPWILRHGADAFAAMGTRSSKGTKAFALAGKIAHGGLIEVPMGLSLRDVVMQLGGGIENGRQFKAVQVGGPSGGCLPESLADIPIDYVDLKAEGAMMGSGGLVVLDDTDCMVDIARYFLAFTQQESCGKCTFCRIGTRRMLDILERLCTGESKPGDIDLLEHLAHEVQRGSLCGLGKTAPNPVLSTLKHFREEYAAHLEGRCPAKRCKALIHYAVNDRCIGCTRCAQCCPVDAIAMRPYEQHEIDTTLCTRCDACRTACPANAIDIIDAA